MLLIFTKQLERDVKVMLHPTSNHVRRTMK